MPLSTLGRAVGGPRKEAPGTQTFNYTGAVQTFKVPYGYTSIVVECWGAQGGDGTGVSANGGPQGLGGKGGYVKATVAVTPNETLNVYVGGKGFLASTPAGTYKEVVATGGGWNGGGHGGDGHSGNVAQRGWVGSGGGGASDIRRGTALSTRLLIAGGGGGAGGQWMDELSTGYDHMGTGGGGGGGYYGGGGGGPGTTAWSNSSTGGTQSEGGLGDQPPGKLATGDTNGYPGAAGVGGKGGRCSATSTNAFEDYGGSTGGAGGGDVGQGGTDRVTRTYVGSGGAGGSNYVTAAGNTLTTSSQGIRSGDGLIVITWG